jgi:hypothetical protein
MYCLKSLLIMQNNWGVIGFSLILSPGALNFFDFK